MNIDTSAEAKKLVNSYFELHVWLDHCVLPDLASKISWSQHEHNDRVAEELMMLEVSAIEIRDKIKEALDELALLTGEASDVSVPDVLQSIPTPPPPSDLFGFVAYFRQAVVRLRKQ